MKKGGGMTKTKLLILFRLLMGKCKLNRKISAKYEQDKIDKA